MRLSLARLVLPALLALAACDGGTDVPEPAGGDYDAVLQSPNGAEAAAALELSGTGIEDVQSSTAFLQSSAVSGGRRVVLVRSQPGTLEFRVRMAEGQAPPDVRVVEVAAPDDALRASLSGYRVTFTRVAGQ
ncbi:MAG TPA: hypothetical protein VLK84_06725 [Longimicrobium sp.]|nr:hypothetical protein [Longimicrobium sp.]